MIYTIGESVLDIIIRNFDDVKIRPGGSMLNTAVSLGRLGVCVSHISFISNDIASNKLVGFLEENKVNTSLILKQAEKTNLALAFLDDNNNATYTFYKDEKGNKVEFSYPKFGANDIVLFGSFFCLNPDYRESVIDFIKKAKRNGATIMYDPNYRKAHSSKLSKYREYVLENIQLADIVKASDEDISNLFDINSSDEAYSFIQKFDVKAFLFTRGEKAAQAFVDRNKYEEPVKKINSVSTIGAGDTFSAGILFSLQQTKGNVLNKLHNHNWSKALKTAGMFAGHVCESYDNYLSNSFIKSFKNV